MKMKKLILGAFLAFSGVNAFGQVTIEHTYMSDDAGFYIVNESTYTSQIKSFIILDKNNDLIEFYSTNNTLSGSLNVELNNFFSISNISVHLFNNDDKIEFIILYNNGGNFEARLVNEDGDELYDFGEYYNLGVFIVDNSYKLISTSPLDGSERIFTLGGTPPGMDLNENGDATQERNAYPNPAKQYINLQYELPKGETASMVIYNQNGERIDALKIGSYFKECQLDVSSYTSGVYFYAYNGITKKFIVQ